MAGDTNYLTPDELAAECARLLEPVTRYVHSKMGAEAADMTGGCLFKALRSYDKSRGGLDAFARTKTMFLVIESMREINGRKGTSRHAMNSSMVEVGEWDSTEGSDPCEDLLLGDQLRRSFSVVSGVSPLGRLILFGRIMCNITDTDLCGLANVSQTKLRSEVLTLQQSVPFN